MEVQKKNCGRILAETLKAYGIDHVFFMDAILRTALREMENVGIRRVLTHSEKAAAYMADGYARAKARPGLCMAQSVGAANLAAGLQDAYLGRSPVVALTGRQPSQNQYRNAYQEIPHEPVFSAVTKFTGRVDVPEQFSLLVRQAFREAASGRPGPSHLDIAGHTGDLIGAAEVTPETGIDAAFGRIPAFRPVPDAGGLTNARRAIEGSERPVIVADSGVTFSRAEARLREYAEYLDIPVVASLDAKTVLPSGHRLQGGIVGTYSQTCANRLVAEADLVIFAGSDTSDQVTCKWRLPVPGTSIIEINITPGELGRNFPGSILLHGDVRATFTALAEGVQRQRREGWVDRMASLVREWEALVDPNAASGDTPIRPERLCREIGNWLPENATVVADTGYASQWAGTTMPLRHQGQRFLRAAGSLGWAFPAALGAKCATPDRTVVCFTGDGGFMYHLPELETARRWDIKTITVVNNNSQLAQGARNIAAVYKGHHGKKEEIHVYRDTDFARIAESFDCFGQRVEHPDQMVKALEAAQASPLPAVIDVRTDPDAHPASAWLPT